MPDVTEQQLSESATNNRSIDILANNDTIQAVKNSKLRITQLAFYKAGSIEIDKGVKVNLDSQGMVMLKMQGGQLKQLTLADPSRKLNRMLVTVSGMYKAQSETFRTILDERRQRTLFIVDVPQGVYLGKSVTISLP